MSGGSSLDGGVFRGSNSLSEKKYWSKWESSRSRGENKKCLKPPPRFISEFDAYIPGGDLEISAIKCDVLIPNQVIYFSNSTFAISFFP